MLHARWTDFVSVSKQICGSGSSETTGMISQREPDVCSAHTDNLQRQSFDVSGPVTWNSLHVALRSSDVTEETSKDIFVYLS